MTETPSIYFLNHLSTKGCWSLNDIEQEAGCRVTLTATAMAALESLIKLTFGLWDETEAQRLPAVRWQHHYATLEWKLIGEKKKKKNLSPLIKTQSHTVIMVVTEKIFPSILDKEKTGRRAKNKPKLKCAQAWKI